MDQPRDLTVRCTVCDAPVTALADHDRRVTIECDRCDARWDVSGQLIPPGTVR